MKAILYHRFGGREVLELEEISAPTPAEGELLIEVERAGVNFVDIRERQGAYNRPETHGQGIGLPHTPGLQAAGTVLTAGSDSDRAWIGKRVLAYTPAGGGYAEQVLAKTEFCAELPDGSDLDRMAALPNQGLTAYLLLTASTVVRPGESVLVQGASGGVGTLAVQLAKLLGAGLVLGTASTEEKRDDIRRLGADDAIDYKRDDWPQQVREKTGGRGVDLILESVGGDIFEKNFDCLAPFGRCLIYGSTRGPGNPLPPRRLMGTAQTLTGFYLPVFLQRPDLIRQGVTFLVEATAAGRLRPSIDRVLPLEQASEAHRLLEDREVRGTVLLNAAASRERNAAQAEYARR